MGGNRFLPFSKQIPNYLSSLKKTNLGFVAFFFIYIHAIFRFGLKKRLHCLYLIAVITESSLVAEDP